MYMYTYMGVSGQLTLPGSTVWPERLSHNQGLVHAQVMTSSHPHKHVHILIFTYNIYMQICTIFIPLGSQNTWTWQTAVFRTFRVNSGFHCQYCGLLNTSKDMFSTWLSATCSGILSYGCSIHVGAFMSTERDTACGQWSTGAVQILNGIR